MKTCTKCKRRLNKQLFFRDIQKKDALTSHCRDCIRKHQIEYYENKRAERLDYSRKYYTQNKAVQIERQREAHKKIVSQIFTLLGNKCLRCGFSDKRALQIDHLNGQGYRHRRIKGGGMSYHKDIIENIIEYQLLCANCNLIEGVEKNYRKTIWN